MSVSASISRRHCLSGLGLAALIMLVPAGAFDAVAFDEASTSPLNLDPSGLALRGHDPVAYFTDGQPMLGEAQYSVEHEGATYHFASAENRDRFAADPDAYVPAYGGFCAMGVAMGKKFDGDPALWRVVDGTLYLNVNEEAQQYWQADIPGNIVQANENWPGIRETAPRDL
jgi:YHS domain-containing protein